MDLSLQKKLEIIVAQCFQEGSFVVSSSWFELARKGKHGDIILENIFNKEQRVIEKYFKPFNIQYKILEHAGSNKKEILFFAANLN